MAFESLSYRYRFSIPEFPYRWLPLIHLYDPDLPLFPMYYFHVISDEIRKGERPGDTQRAFGYVEQIASGEDGNIKVTIVSNKDYNKPENQHYLTKVINEVKERFGIINPVKKGDIQNAFDTPFDASNAVLSEIWERVVSNAYGNMLPYGRLWDEVFGLTRFVATWFSQGGRKGELIQTHYFASKFGVRIQSAGGIPQVDFYLFPTIQELTDITNPLTSFPDYANLVRVAEQIQMNYCSIITIDGIQLSKFNNPTSRKFDTRAIMDILYGPHIPYRFRRQAVECFNSFDKGPQRTIIFLLMLDDLRKGRLKPGLLNSSQCGSIYDSLSNTYQSPKVIQIYAQQSFANTSAMPIDTWVETFFRWPLKVWPTKRTKNMYQNIFSHSQNLGKVERLIWVTAQARKVHSSACDNALWCLKKASNGKARGANPLACNICLDAIRNLCPAYREIKNERVCFNSELIPEVRFSIITSAGDNVTPNQTFRYCKGNSIYNEIFDDFSPDDNPNGFAPYPDPNHNGTIITVDEFVRIY